MVTFLDADCHVGLRPPRNDTFFNMLKNPDIRENVGIFQIVKKRPIQAKPIPSPGGKVAPEGGRKTAPSGACGEQPPKAALSERRNSGGNL